MTHTLLLVAMSALAGDPSELVSQIETAHGLTPEQTGVVRGILEGNSLIGQGNGRVTRHPMTPEECQTRVEAAGVVYRDPRFEEICGGPYMAPLYDPATQTPEQATACIDQFEFPDIPCTYPVIWVRAREAQELCEAMGKRLCDAHEWEGACDGALLEPDYRFDLALGRSPADSVRAMQKSHNDTWSPFKRYAYGGPDYQRGVCAAASVKSDGCNGGDSAACGSNTYPSGAFPGCRSPLGVYDQHGNAAEHMNLPLDDSQMASRGSETLGVTEMKGSWFIFDTYHAHEDWCRWRAPYWHGGPVMATDSHRNYHLGFRCCRTLGHQE